MSNVTRSHKRKTTPPPTPLPPDTPTPHAATTATPATHATKPPRVTKDDLPIEAYAIYGMDFHDTSQWQLPHHTKYIGVPGKGVEQTVDWPLADKAVLLISRYGIDGQRVLADPQLIINAAIHLAGHYRKAGLPIPNALCVYDTSGN